jgi:signal transduction histidine kinase
MKILKESILFKRIITILFVTAILTALLSAGIFIVVTQKMVAQTRAEELLPIARTVAEMVTNLSQSEEADRGVAPLFDRENKNFLGASLHIYDQNGFSLMGRGVDKGKGVGKRADELGNGIGEGEADLEEALGTMLSDDLSAVLSGKEVSGVRKSDRGIEYLVVGVPAMSDGAPVGAVLFTKPMSELSEARKSLNVTLVISALFGILIMLIPGYFMAKKLSVPIRQMSAVAGAMAKGDYSLRADETQKGEIGELAHAINHFAVESGHLEQTRQAYVANVSHELRTPIAAIRAIGETLRDGMAKTEEKRQMFYNSIVRESMRLSRLVEDLLELSRLQSDAIAMQKTRFDLAESMRNIADVYGRAAKRGNVQFHLEMDGDDAVYAHSNPDRIEQVLIILLDNAFKHTPQGGSINISLRSAGDKHEVCVSNTGEGISEEDLPHIFERFYKADKSHSGEGNGLGLSIAKEIVRGLGESIRVESDSDSTRFILSVSCN